MRLADGLVLVLWGLCGLSWWSGQPWFALLLLVLLALGCTWQAWLTRRDTRTLHSQLERAHQDNRQRWLEED